MARSRAAAILPRSDLAPAPTEMMIGTQQIGCARRRIQPLRQYARRIRNIVADGQQLNAIEHRSRTSPVLHSQQREPGRKDFPAESRRLHRGAAQDNQAMARRDAHYRQTNPHPPLESAVSYTVATDSRPELIMRRANSAVGANVRTALRKARSACRMRRDEVGRTRRMGDVLVGRLNPLGVIARDQCVSCLTLDARRRASRPGFPRPERRNWHRARRTGKPDGRHRR